MTVMQSMKSYFLRLMQLLDNIHIIDVPFLGWGICMTGKLMLGNKKGRLY